MKRVNTHICKMLNCCLKAPTFQNISEENAAIGHFIFPENFGHLVLVMYLLYQCKEVH